MARAADLKRAAQLALSGDWNAAHEIAQTSETDPVACWLHAVLHKIEGDDWNSRYWYRRAGRSFGTFSDPKVELAAIISAIP